jgi:pimeloyl-ACP methyl ester carboxylesterase
MRVHAHGLEIECDAFGDAKDPPMLLVMGFAQQMTTWDERFCGLLAARGLYVVRFDNRDIGLSTKIESAPRPNFPAIVGGDLSTLAYSIEDMADDTAGLLDALGFASAHVVGMSMGGMIAQALAVHHPGRVTSLGSIMSTTGDPRVGHPSPEVIALVMKRPPPGRDENIELGVRVWNAIRSPGYPFNEAQVRERVARAYDRGFYPPGLARQAAAIMAQRDRTARLHDVRVPTVVIHGAEDPLINRSGGEATARAIPGAKLVIVPGMGHDLPEGVWGVVIDALVDNAVSTTA